MGCELSALHSGCACFRTGCRGGCLNLRDMKWQEGGGELRNEELHDLHSSPSLIRMTKWRRMRWAGHVATGDKRNACRILVWTSEGKRPLARTECRWKDVTEMDIIERWWGGMGRVILTQDREQLRDFVKMVMNPWVFIKCREIRK
jgi:hypothetical protein